MPDASDGLIVDRPQAVEDGINRFFLALYVMLEEMEQIELERLDLLARAGPLLAGVEKAWPTSQSGPQALVLIAQLPSHPILAQKNAQSWVDPGLLPGHMSLQVE